jgi:hypothetical protein
MAYSRLALCVLVLLFVRSGIPTNLQTPLSKFSKYEKPVQIQQIDWLMLQANLELVRQNSHWESIDTPRLSFNPTTKRIEAFANVNADELAKLPVGEVKARLWEVASMTGWSAGFFIKDLEVNRGPDFYMKFRGVSAQDTKTAVLAGKDLPMRTFAEFQDGQVTLR